MPEFIVNEDESIEDFLKDKNYEKHLTALKREPQLMQINKSVKQRALVEYNLRRVSE